MYDIVELSFGAPCDLTVIPTLVENKIARPQIFLSYGRGQSVEEVRLVPPANCELKLLFQVQQSLPYKAAAVKIKRGNGLTFSLKASMVRHAQVLLALIDELHSELLLKFP